MTSLIYYLFYYPMFTLSVIHDPVLFIGSRFEGSLSVKKTVMVF